MVKNEKVSKLKYYFTLSVYSKVFYLKTYIHILVENKYGLLQLNWFLVPVTHICIF